MTKLKCVIYLFGAGANCAFACLDWKTDGPVFLTMGIVFLVIGLMDLSKLKEEV